MQPTLYSYYFQITIFIIEKAKTAKNILDKKALTGIAAPML